MKTTTTLLFALTLAACSSSSSESATTESTAPPSTAEPEAPAAPEEHTAQHGGDQDHEAHAAAAEGRAPIRQNEDGSQLYGGELTDDLEPVSLASLLENPAEYDGQTVKTEGEITRVCERMGCWMELREGESPAIRVPMAGHAFFLPREVSGRRATIEGRVEVRELDPATQEHLRSEGAEAAESELGIHASAVLVHAPAG